MVVPTATVIRFGKKRFTVDVNFAEGGPEVLGLYRKRTGTRCCRSGVMRVAGTLLIQRLEGMRT
jgi:hypothetical protein